MSRDPFSQPSLLCLDFDGTLVDTRPMWEAAYHRVAEQRQHQLPVNWWASIAGKSMDASAVVFDVHDPAEQKTVSQTLVDAAFSLAATHPPIVLPGANELFLRAEAANIACCIVTSTWTSLAVKLASVAGFPPIKVIGGDQVATGKPAPDIYLNAVSQHAVDPCDCVAVEDSPSGVAAALAAGLCVYTLGEHPVYDRLRQRHISMLDAIRFAP